MSQPFDASRFVPQTVDGIAVEPSVITYTEQVLAAKEATLRKYITENYAKIQNVEKELQSLTLEVKLTSGSKKAALEMLRKKIEQSSERIKAARVKEQVAKTAWEAAAKVVSEEEAAKAKLCTDLNLMVHESAMQQYSKLEELTRKLDALNPDLAGGAMQALEGLRAKIAPHGAPSLATPNQDGVSGGNPGAPDGAAPEAGKEPSSANDGSPEAKSDPGPGQSGEAPAGTAAGSAGGAPNGPKGKGESPAERKAGGHVPLKGRGRGRGGRGRGGAMLLKPPNSSSNGNQWTGAGFDVEDGDGVV